jgi:hypothetical protein
MQSEQIDNQRGNLELVRIEVDAVETRHLHQQQRHFHCFHSQMMEEKTKQRDE